MRWRPGLCPGPRWGSSRRSPDPLVDWRGGHPSPIHTPSAPSASLFSRLAPSAMDSYILVLLSRTPCFGAQLLCPQCKILATPLRMTRHKSSESNIFLTDRLTVRVILVLLLYTCSELLVRTRAHISQSYGPNKAFLVTRSTDELSLQMSCESCGRTRQFHT